MAKVKTFMEKIGFEDDDSKTQEHDEIVLKLMDKEKMFNIITTCYPEVKSTGNWAGVVDLVEDIFPSIWSKQSLCKHIWNDLFEINKEDKSFLDCKVDISDLMKEYKETYHISKETEETVALAIAKKIKEIQDDYKRFKEQKSEIDIKVEQPITKGNEQYKTIIGFLDFGVYLECPCTIYFSSFKNHLTSYGFFVEVETKINSLGYVLRKMKTYMEFTTLRPILITKTNSKMKEAVESQGIKVYNLV